MAIETLCPACGRKHQLPVAYVGRRVICSARDCGASFVVAAPDAIQETWSDTIECTISKTDPEFHVFGDSDCAVMTARSITGRRRQSAGIATSDVQGAPMIFGLAALAVAMIASLGLIRTVFFH